MRLADPEQLAHVGLTLYERKALMALMLCGVADAATLCREGHVPTSKIYLAMEKLAGLGLVQVQPTRPKMFAALPPEVVVARCRRDGARAIGPIRRAGRRTCRRRSRASSLGCAAGTRSSIWRWVSRATIGVTSCRSRRPGSAFCPTWKRAI